jgi:Bacterial regulatory proteins, tetR family
MGSGFSRCRAISAHGSRSCTRLDTLIPRRTLLHQSQSKNKGERTQRRHGTHAENGGGQTRADHRCGSAGLRARCGFARATTSEIAREAGNMTPGLIYYYFKFKNKEDLRKRGSAGAFTEAFLDADPSRDAGVAARCAFAPGCRASPGSDGG